MTSPTMIELLSERSEDELRSIVLNDVMCTLLHILGKADNVTIAYRYKSINSIRNYPLISGLTVDQQSAVLKACDECERNLDHRVKLTAAMKNRLIKEQRYRSVIREFEHDIELISGESFASEVKLFWMNRDDQDNE